MNKPGLIIGIDYTNEYCQACYYSPKHGRPESISAGTEVMRYLIPTALCRNSESGTWLIGSAALEYAQDTGTYLFQDLLDNAMTTETCYIDDREYSYAELLAVYFGKLIELIQIRSAVMSIDSITVNLRKVTLEIKDKIEEAFGYLKIDASKVRLLTCAESFAYYVLNEPEELWADGSLLFDFGNDGFFAKLLTVVFDRGERLVYVNERSYPMDFSMKDLASVSLRNQLDEKLGMVYEDLKTDGPRSSVYFTGEGFNELWFKDTLKDISSERRAFKGNNIYVKGACLAGYLRSEDEQQDFSVICKGRTKSEISVEVRYMGRPVKVTLARACVDWYDAFADIDFLLGDEKSICFNITSLVSRETTQVEFDLSQFPDRPPLTTRVEVAVRYLNDAECEISVTDKGFGEFYPASGETVTKRLNLEGYI